MKLGSSKERVRGTAAFAAVLFFFCASSAAFAGEYPWELKKNEDGVQVSVRKVEGSPILEYRGTVRVNEGLQKVMQLFENDARMPEWFHQCTEARTLKEETPDSKILYFALHMPWPVKDRDAVFRRVRSEEAVTGVVRYVTLALPHEYPEREGKVRMPYLKGLWRFTPLADGGTEIYYQQHSEVGGHIPDWLVNRLAVNIPFNSLVRFRACLGGKK